MRKGESNKGRPESPEMDRRRRTKLEKTNREEIQFQTLQFNQHYSSPGSSKCGNALKTRKTSQRSYYALQRSG